MTIHFLSDIVIILLAAVLIVATFRKLNVSPVLGYFVAGSLIGSHALGIVDPKDLTIFAEFGVVFLLFAIGLEMTYERLQSMRRHVFGFGTLQVLITAFIIGGLLHLVFDMSLPVVIVIGGGLALSSTAIVLQVIAETRTQSTQVGRLSLATLILQDFAVVPLLVLVPILAGETSSFVYSLGMSFLKAILAVVLIFVVGRSLLRPLFNMISSSIPARTNELFVATTLLIALGAAWTTEHLGLSLALGAFFAGALVAETEFQHQAEESIMPFKGLFLGLFFMTVGMEINIAYIFENLLVILSGAAALMIFKALVIMSLALAFGFTLPSAIHAGLLLSQGGEFAFILFGLAAEKNILSTNQSQILLSVVTLTMALTPLMSLLGRHLASRMDHKVFDTKKTLKEIADLNRHVIIIGFGRVGRMVARLLEAEHVAYISIDINQEVVEEARNDGFPVYWGDGAYLETLHTIGIGRAVCVISTVENEITIKKTLKAVHQEYQTLPVIVRAKDLSQSKLLKEAGVTVVVPETYETGLQLGGAALKTVGISEFEVSRIKNQFRAGNYILAKDLDDDFMDEPLADHLSTESKHHS